MRKWIKKTTERWFLGENHSGAITDFYKKYISPEYDETYEKLFDEYCEDIGQFFFVFLIHFALWAVLLTWPIDYYFYGSDPELFYYINLWRITTFTIAFSALVLHHLTRLTEYYWSEIFFLALIGVTFSIYLSLSQIGGLDEPWFYSTYCLPMLPALFFNLKWRRRLVFSFGIPAIAVVAYFGTNPQYFEYPFVASPLILVVIFASIATIVGQIFHNIFKRSFIQTRRFEESLQQKQTLLEEVHHRVKNNLQTISSMLKLQAQHVGSADPKELLRSSRNRVRSMARIHEQLYKNEDFSELNFPEYVRGLCEHQLKMHSGEDRIDLQLDVDEPNLNMNKTINCGLLVNELISNSLEHGIQSGNQGTIEVELTQTDRGIIRLRVSDDGTGLADANNLDEAANTGLTIVESLVHYGLDGNLEFQSNGGLTITAEFEEKKPPAENL